MLHKFACTPRIGVGSDFNYNIIKSKKENNKNNKSKKLINVISSSI
jgi:hypothetical protein